MAGLLGGSIPPHATRLGVRVAPLVEPVAGSGHPAPIAI